MHWLWADVVIAAGLATAFLGARAIAACPRCALGLVPYGPWLVFAGLALALAGTAALRGAAAPATAAAIVGSAVFLLAGLVAGHGIGGECRTTIVRDGPGTVECTSWVRWWVWPVVASGVASLGAALAAAVPYVARRTRA